MSDLGALITRIERAVVGHRYALPSSSVTVEGTSFEERRWRESIRATVGSVLDSYVLQVRDALDASQARSAQLERELAEVRERVSRAEDYAATIDRQLERLEALRQEWAPIVAQYQAARADVSAREEP